MQYIFGVLQDSWFAGHVPRSGGQVNPDGAHVGSYVPHLRENSTLRLSRHDETTSLPVNEIQIAKTFC